MITTENIADEAQVYWNRNDDWTRKVSHFLNYGKYSEKRWRKIGESNWKRFVSIVKELNLDLSSFRVACEWGTGGGSNVVKLSDHFSLIYGVDISKQSLRETSKQLQHIRREHLFRPLAIECSDPELVIDRMSNRAADLFLSTACFHHFPSREYAERIIQIAFRVLREGGLAIIQFRLNDGGQFYRPKTKDYLGGKKRNAIRFCSHTLSEFYDMTLRVGFANTDYVEFKPANCVYAYLIKP